MRCTLRSRAWLTHGARGRQIVVPDKWTAGARNVTGGKHGGRSVGKVRSKTTTRKKHRHNPLSKPCRICKCKVHQVGSHYCNDCAYQKGICAMCGRKQVKTKGYKMST